MSKDQKIVSVGCKILLKIDQDEEEYTLVYPKEADVLKFKISTESPVGQAILGKKKGDEVEIKIRGAKLSCKILNVKPNK